MLRNNARSFRVRQPLARAPVPARRALDGLHVERPHAQPALEREPAEPRASRHGPGARRRLRHDARRRGQPRRVVLPLCVRLSLMLVLRASYKLKLNVRALLYLQATSNGTSKSASPSNSSKRPTSRSSATRSRSSRTTSAARSGSPSRATPRGTRP